MKPAQLRSQGIKRVSAKIGIPAPFTVTVGTGTVTTGTAVGVRLHRPAVGIMRSDGNTNPQDQLTR